MSKEAMKLALEALEQLDGIDTETECVTIDVGDVITALREALAEQPAQQEPVVRWDSDGWGDLLVDGLPDGTLLYTSPSNQPGYQAMAMAVTRLQKRCLELEGKQPAQQEPVATITITQRGPIRIIDNNFDDCVRGWPDGEYKLYTSPQPAQPDAGFPASEKQEPVYHLRQYGDVTKEQLDRYMATGDINPQPAQRKPLTDGEIDTIRLSTGYAAGLDRFINITRAIEAAHGIKENT
jgi:hypothetical protein